MHAVTVELGTLVTIPTLGREGDLAAGHETRQ
jgi:hypothetical protein